MEKDLVDIVMEKEYIELSADEKAELEDFCSSESEFYQLKQVFEDVGSIQFDLPSPRKETKQRLDDLFNDIHPKAAPIWYMSVFSFVVPREKPLYKQPLMQIAAVGLLLLLIFPFFNNEMTPDNTQIANIEKVEKIEQEIEEASVVPPGVDEVKVDEVKIVEEVIESIREESKTEAGTREITSMDFAFTDAAASAEPAIARTAAPGADHPDGIFDPALYGEIAFSQPASSNPDMLDLLTATF